MYYCPCVFLQRANSGSVCRWKAGSSSSALCPRCSRTADLTWGTRPRSYAGTSRASPEHTHRHTSLSQANTHTLKIQKTNLYSFTHTTSQYYTPFSGPVQNPGCSSSDIHWSLKHLYYLTVPPMFLESGLSESDCSIQVDWIQAHGWRNFWIMSWRYCIVTTRPESKRGRWWWGGR